MTDHQSIASDTRSDADPLARDDDDALKHIRHAIRGLRYGHVVVVVQDGVVVQVDRMDRRRIVRQSPK